MWVVLISVSFLWYIIIVDSSLPVIDIVDVTLISGLNAPNKLNYRFLTFKL